MATAVLDFDQWPRSTHETRMAFGLPRIVQHCGSDLPSHAERSRIAMGQKQDRMSVTVDGDTLPS